MYKDLEASLHDLFWSSEGAPSEQPLIKDFLQTYSGSALELGCGSGRLLLPLLEDGYLVEGLDNSEEMLELCRASAGDSDPVLHHASMASFQTGSIYGAMMIPAFTLQFISPEELPSVLAHIKSHLHPGGGLYITTFIPWAEITGELEEGKWLLDHEAKIGEAGVARDTAKCHTKFSIKRLSQQLTRNHRYKVVSPQGKVLQTSESTHQLSWYWPREMEGYLQAAGFSVQQTIGDFDPEVPCDENSQVITVIAKLDDEEGAEALA